MVWSGGDGVGQGVASIVSVMAMVDVAALRHQHVAVLLAGGGGTEQVDIRLKLFLTCISTRSVFPPVLLMRERTPKPESTEAMGRGVATRDDGQGKANGAGPIPVDGDEGGVRLAHSYDDGGPQWRCWAKLSG